MLLLRVLLVLIWVAAFLSGRALFDISGAVSEGAKAQHRAGGTPLVWDTSAEVQPRQPVPGRPFLDRYGNPISEAVSDYRIDRRGELYERHAPDTALLKLKSPGV